MLLHSPCHEHPWEWVGSPWGGPTCIRVCGGCMGSCCRRMGRQGDRQPLCANLAAESTMEPLIQCSVHIQRCFALLVLCHGVGEGFPQGFPWGCWGAGCTLLGCCCWAGLRLASLGLNCCFLWEEEKAEQAPLNGVQGEFSYMSCCMIVLGTIHCAKTFSFT